MSWFDRVAMNYTIYTMSCNFATHEICLLALMTYKYNELQRSNATQKLSCKASCKTTFFHNDFINKKDHPNHNRHVEIDLSKMIESSF
jgi:hypothetical protein